MKRAPSSVAEGEGEVDGLVNGGDLLGAEQGDVAVEPLSVYRRDRVQVGNALLRQAVLGAKRNFGPNTEGASSYGGDGEGSAHIIGGVSGEQHDGPASRGQRDIRPPDLAASHSRFPGCQGFFSKAPTAVALAQSMSSLVSGRAR